MKSCNELKSWWFPLRRYPLCKQHRKLLATASLSHLWRKMDRWFVQGWLYGKAQPQVTYWYLDLKVRRFEGLNGFLWWQCCNDPHRWCVALGLRYSGTLWLLQSTTTQENSLRCTEISNSDYLTLFRHFAFFMRDERTTGKPRFRFCFCYFVSKPPTSPWQLNSIHANKNKRYRTTKRGNFPGPTDPFFVRLVAQPSRQGNNGGRRSTTMDDACQPRLGNDIKGKNMAAWTDWYRIR